MCGTVGDVELIVGSCISANSILYSVDLMIGVLNTLLINGSCFGGVFKYKCTGIFGEVVKWCRCTDAVIAEMQTRIELWEIQVFPTVLRILGRICHKPGVAWYLNIKRASCRGLRIGSFWKINLKKAPGFWGVRCLLATDKYKQDEKRCNAYPHVILHCSKFPSSFPPGESTFHIHS